jgi:hypothetical protein
MRRRGAVGDQNTASPGSPLPRPRRPLFDDLPPKSASTNPRAALRTASHRVASEIRSRRANRAKGFVLFPSTAPTVDGVARHLHWSMETARTPLRITSGKGSASASGISIGSLCAKCSGKFRITKSLFRRKARTQLPDHCDVNRRPKIRKKPNMRG